MCQGCYSLLSSSFYLVEFYELQKLSPNVGHSEHVAEDGVISGVVAVIFISVTCILSPHQFLL
jgi:hypothetical protein